MSHQTQSAIDDPAKRVGDAIERYAARCGGVDETTAVVPAVRGDAQAPSKLVFLPREIWIKVLEQLGNLDPVDFFRARQISRSFDVMVKQSRPTFSFEAHLKEKWRSGPYKKSIRDLLR